MVRSSMLVSALATATLVLGIPLPGPPAASPPENGQDYKDASSTRSSLLADVHGPVPTTVLLQLDSENESIRKKAREDLQSQQDTSQDTSQDTPGADKTTLLNILPRVPSSSPTTYKKMPTTYGPLAVIRSLDFETLIIWTSYRPLWAWSIIASMLLLLFIFSLALFEVAGCMLRAWRTSRLNGPTRRHTDGHTTRARLVRKSKPSEKKTGVH